MKKYYIIMKSVFALSLPISILFSTPAIQAYDVKSWNGANCQAYYGSQESSLIKGTNGIYNSSSNYRWVTCGIVRDKLLTYPSALGTRAFNVYVHPSNGGRLTCYLREVSVTGGAVQTKSGSRTTPGYLTLNTSVSHTNGSRVLLCSLPPASRISHIRSFEYLSTDSNS